MASDGVQAVRPALRWSAEQMGFRWADDGCLAWHSRHLSPELLIDYDLRTIREELVRNFSHAAHFARGLNCEEVGDGE